MEPHVRRRIEFLISEASADEPVRDMAIKMIERSVSNFATLGVSSGTSKAVKKINSWMSRAAYEKAIELGSYDRWHDETTNEHEVELVSGWRKLCACRGNMSVDEVFQLFSSPFITVLNAENDRLRSIKASAATQRYVLAGIEVGKVDGLWKRGGRLAYPPPEFVAREAS